jgi:putative glutamine amidotransferase
MSSGPHIGVPTQTLQSIDGIPAGLPHSWVMNHRYYVALESVGAVPWMIPLLAGEHTLRRMYEQLDGIFIAGGVDMDPASYGHERSEKCGRTDPERDRVELLFARWAAEDGKPIFGVCRGMQIINVAAGGTLFQDCATDLPDAIRHDYFPTDGHARDFLAHEIDIAPGSRLAAAFGATRALVNSMHHQGLATVGEALTVTATAPDGLIEALEGAHGGFRVGVQWHPEMLIDSDAATRRLFEAFVSAALAWRGTRNVLA